MCFLSVTLHMCVCVYVSVFVCLLTIPASSVLKVPLPLTPAAYLSIVKNIIFLCVFLCVLGDVYDLSQFELLHTCFLYVNARFFVFRLSFHLSLTASG